MNKENDVLNKQMKLSDLYRRLPHFKGKYRLGNILFKKAISLQNPPPIRGRNKICYHLLNTKDSIGRDLFFDGVYEPETVALIKSLLLPNDVFIDAGANIGAISLPVAQDGKVKVYAFEPGKRIFAVLRENISLNKFRNIVPVNKALSHAPGSTDFYESDRVHGWSGLVKINSFEQYRVETITLDAFCAQQQIGHICVLKMDVQGWEYFVLKGADRLFLEDRIEHVIFEFEWWAEENAGLRPGAAQEFLLERGFQLKYLSGRPLGQPLRTGTVMLWATKGSHVSNAV